MTVRNADRLQRTLRALRQESNPMLERAMELAQGMVHRMAAATVPVVTGRLKGSLMWTPATWQGNTLHGRVGTNVEYAPPVEARKPYLGPALTQQADAINDLFAQEVRGSLVE